MNMKYHNTQRGFSMIETLVAITMLTLAVSAPLTLAGKSLIAANYAKDQVTAFNLAQEAVELVRFHRDNQLICMARGLAVSGCAPTDDWLSKISATTGGASLVGVASTTVPFTVDTSTGNMAACPTTCSPLSFQASSGLYTYTTGVGYTASRFTRTVTVTKRGATAPDSSQATVRSVVTWSGALGITRTVSIEEDIYQWVPSL
jgi:prepilin-type N-terminal cleavage/methylation domain-containing protein